MSSYELTTAEALIRFIRESPKTTPVKVYVLGEIRTVPDTANMVKIFHPERDPLLIGEADQVAALLEANRSSIRDTYVEYDRRNSAVPLLDLLTVEARIEPGAVIRDRVTIGKGCVVMMGAVINIGAVVGDRTMIDMNAVVGGRALIGANCHVGAGAVLAGVIEPPSATPVVIEDDVLIGANAVVVEGVRIGRGAVVAAGAVVIEDIAPDTVVAGVPAQVIKRVDDKTRAKTQIVDALRALPGR
ncbi:MAG: 2,3,4,5-tetrahydropyridine-2,6-dicarboxylate N-acetyltransferase [candidate division Zixibacteria bacterium]|nr:2,3,4,5-tetrahydropyridine-2,6-dicarboxylate N-acetyltransferase [candidate division Zixibacteria bacterium]